jgi:hypothetical protein
MYLREKNMTDISVKSADSKLRHPYLTLRGSVRKGYNLLTAVLYEMI